MNTRLPGRRTIPRHMGGAHEHRPVPTVAIVDSRNVHGWTGRVLGRTGLPSVAGVVKALAPYGFDVIDVHVAIAIASGHGGTERVQRQSDGNRAYRGRVLDDPRGHHLHGELRTTGEKRVDVVCAVEICRQAHLIVSGACEHRAICVLSHDTDLVPALDYARSLGVEAFVVTADGRSSDGSRPWLLLGEAALRDLVDVAPGHLGNDLRRAVAHYAQTPRAEDWYIEAEHDPKHRVDGRMMVRALTQAPLRIPGVAPPGAGRVGTMLRQWWPSGVHLDRTDSFPYVLLAADGPARPSSALHNVKALARVSATRLLVEHPTRRGTRLSIDVPPGGAVAGAIVCVAEIRVPGMSPTFRYVANMTKHEPAVEFGFAVLAQVRSARGTRASVVVTDTGHELLVRHPAGRNLTVGAWHAVWIIDVAGTEAVPLSSALPDP